MRLALRAAAVPVLAILIAACASGGLSSAASSVGPPAAASPSAPGAPSKEASPMSVMPSTSTPSANAAGTFTITSSAFADGDAIPKEFTCDGANVSPPVAWSGVPAGTVALVLVVDDPDANNFVHWTVLDLDPTTGDVTQGVDPGTATIEQGMNSFGKAGWGGPCPPSGTHHYRFTLTALGGKLGLPDQPKPDAVRDALNKAVGRVLGTATLTATYTRG